MPTSMQERADAGVCAPQAANAPAIARASSDAAFRTAELRWYAVHVPAGRERALADACARLIDRSILQDSFVPAYEKWMKQGGAWRIVEALMFPEYFIVATQQPRTLARSIARMSHPLALVGAQGRHYAPLSRDVQSWLGSALDGFHVLRASVGRIEDGSLTVEQGPLRGRESDVRRINRHKRMAYVGLGGADDGEFVIRAALSVPVKQ